MTQCIKCGTTLTKESNKGRPAVYCSTGCRRAAELEIGRINRRLADNEEMLISNRRTKSTVRDGDGLRPAELVEALEQQILLDEQRLKLLLNAGESEL